MEIVHIKSLIQFLKRDITHIKKHKAQKTKHVNELFKGKGGFL